MCTNLVYLNIIIAMKMCVNRTQSQQFSISLAAAAVCRLITLLLRNILFSLSTSILFKFLMFKWLIKSPFIFFSASHMCVTLDSAISSWTCKWHSTQVCRSKREPPIELSRQLAVCTRGSLQLKFKTHFYSLFLPINFLKREILNYIWAARRKRKKNSFRVRIEIESRRNKRRATVPLGPLHHVCLSSPVEYVSTRTNSISFREEFNAHTRRVETLWLIFSIWNWKKNCMEYEHMHSPDLPMGWELQIS